MIPQHLLNQAEQLGFILEEGYFIDGYNNKHNCIHMKLNELTYEFKFLDEYMGFIRGSYEVLENRLELKDNKFVITEEYKNKLKKYEKLRKESEKIRKEKGIDKNGKINPV